MTQVLVQYPSGPAFDQDYYLKTHMPLVERTWKPFGLIGWEILAFPADSPYQIQARLTFKSAEDWATASAQPGGKAVIDDIPNFTASKPIILAGQVAGASA